MTQKSYSSICRLKLKKLNDMDFYLVTYSSISRNGTISDVKNSIDAGCKIVNFGLQSGSPKIRKEILNRNESNQNVTVVAEACKKYKLNFAIDCILNIPNDNEESIKESIGFFNQIHPNLVLEV